MIEIISEPINDRFYNLVADSKSRIRLCAPYVKEEIVNNIYGKLALYNLLLNGVDSMACMNFKDIVYLPKSKYKNYDLVSFIDEREV